MMHMHHIKYEEALDLCIASNSEVAMKFIHLCHYIEDLDRVAELRPAHRQYMAQLDAESKLWAAGPFENGKGALFIYEAVDQQAAEEIRQVDPYVTGGALAVSELTAWSPALYNTSVQGASSK
jgi:uncharacterized protein YciI